MTSPRPSKKLIKPEDDEATSPPPTFGSPLHLPGAPDHNFHTQTVFNINAQVAKLEAGFATVESRLSKVESKVDAISDDVVEAKATFKTVKFLFIGMFTGTWGLISALVIVWAKHHFGW